MLAVHKLLQHDLYQSESIKIMHHRIHRSFLKLGQTNTKLCGKGCSFFVQCQCTAKYSCKFEDFQLFLARNHPYITSGKGLAGWVGSKKGGGEFADVQYCIYADIVGGSEKVQKYSDVIYGWSPRIQL